MNRAMGGGKPTVRFVRVDPAKPDPVVVADACDELRAGALAVLPTDTGYALCGLATDEGVLQKVYRTKGRDPSKPLHVLVAARADAERLVDVEPRVARAIERLLPGALTLVLPARPDAPRGLNPAGTTIGIRIPDLPFTLAVLARLGAPLTATSANPSGGPAPFASEDLAGCTELAEVSVVYDAGSLPHRRPSTIVEVLPGQLPRLLREGPVELSAVLAVL
jgi:L-threonylcarbamoyladenylate synthase